MKAVQFLSKNVAKMVKPGLRLAPVRTNMIGKKAPEFSGLACMGDNSIKDISLEDYKGKKVVMYFYPADFTFVCSSELPAFAELEAEFQKAGAELVGVSTDTAFTHKAWKSASSELGGLNGFEINHPVIGDHTTEISQAYDVVMPNGLACRAVFVIDEDGVIQVEHRNNAPLGRNTAEALRSVQALMEHQQTGKVIPANWTPGSDTMSETTESVDEYLKKLKKN